MRPPAPVLPLAPALPLAPGSPSMSCPGVARRLGGVRAELSNRRWSSARIPSS